VCISWGNGFCDFNVGSPVCTDEHGRGTQCGVRRRPRQVAAPARRLYPYFRCQQQDLLGFVHVDTPVDIFTTIFHAMPANVDRATWQDAAAAIICLGISLQTRVHALLLTHTCTWLHSRTTEKSRVESTRRVWCGVHASSECVARQEECSTWDAHAFASKSARTLRPRM